MNTRILVLVLLVAAVAIGALWLASGNPQGTLEQAGEDMPSIEMGTGETTITVPSDADIVTRERTIDGETYEYPDIDVKTEERAIEYPTVDVVPADEKAAADPTIEPVMRGPNDPVPAVDAEEAYEDAKDAVEEEIDDLDKNNNGSIVE